MKVIVQETPEDCAKYAEEQIVAAVHQAAEAGRPCRIVLAGGSTPKLLYEKLAKLPPGSIDWNRVSLFWGDERDVPPEHADSNFRMVKQAMLDHLDDRHQPRCFRIPTGELSAPEAAAAYERTLAAEAAGSDGLQFDVVLLGIGDDAHTASLFPETAALRVNDQMVAANWVEKLNTWRVTLTYPSLNRAREVYFLVCGASKTAALQQIWGPDKNIEQYPAQGIQPEAGHVTWIIDQAAAVGLPSSMLPN